MITVVFTVKVTDSSNMACFKSLGIIALRHICLLKFSRKPHSTMKITKSTTSEAFNNVVPAKKSLFILQSLSSYSNVFSAIITEHARQNLTQDKTCLLFCSPAKQLFLSSMLLCRSPI